MNATEFIGQTLHVIIDRPLGSKHPRYGFTYPVNYGYLPGAPSGDGEEMDVYVLGVFEPLEEFEGECIAVIHRLDDADDKLVLVPAGVQYSDEQICVLTEFQERFFETVLMRSSSSDYGP